LDVAQELSTATMMICPSRADVSPNAVKEAVVAGVPVIGTTVGGIPDYVFSGLNGVLCPPDNALELAKAIRCACGHAMFSRGQVDAATLAKTREYLSPQLMAQKFGSIYQRLHERR
jgi:glycosyltransferase involved in cell wall biosynthesis